MIRSRWKTTLLGQQVKELLSGKDYLQAFVPVIKNYHETHGGKSTREPGAQIWKNLKDNDRVGGGVG